jgi:hypothetical protein
MSNNLSLDDLGRAINMLRAQLPPGAPILALATVRARDRIETASGLLVPFGLLSSAFYDEQFGDYTVMDKPHLYLFNGVLGRRHIPSLLPLFEQVAKNHTPLVMAANDADEDVLAMIALNKKRGSMRGAVLVPDSPTIPLPMTVLERATGATTGSATPLDLRLDKPALPQRIVSTLHESALITQPKTPVEPPSLGLLYVGGDDLPAARARAGAARSMLSGARWG